MAVQIQLSVAVLVAAVVGEAVSYVWYSDLLPLRRWGDERYWTTALACEFALAVLLQYFISHKWAIRRWQDAVSLAVWTSLLYAVCQAPHSVYGPSTLITMAYCTAHKFLLVCSMTLAMYYVRKAGH